MAERVIDVRGVTLGYGGAPVLRDLDVAVARGDILCLIGGSGSGKTTLLHAMVGLLAPMEGVVELLGERLDRLDRDERAWLLRRIGLVFQHDALFGDLSALDNVAMPAREVAGLPAAFAEELARRKLAQVKLSGLERQQPDELSGGQRKRVAIARAIVLDPELVFCDEPTGGLDPVSAAGVDEALARLRDSFGVTVVAVTHDIGLVKAIADRVVMLGDGGVLAEGDPDVLEACQDPYVHGFMRRALPGA